MAAMNGDKYTFLNSTASSNNQPVYTSKQWAYQIDQNSGSYSSKQIVFDLSGFYNSQRFIDPSEMFIVLPVVSTLTSLAGPGNLHAQGGLGAAPKFTEDPALQFADNNGQITDQYSMGFKSGFWNLINSIQIQVDGKDVIQLTPNINYHASFVANTTWSESDIKKHGATCGFYPDDADSWTVNSHGCFSDAGYGVCNNGLPPANKAQIFPNADPTHASARTTAGLRDLYFSEYGPQSTVNTANSGFWNRLKTTNMFDPELFITGLGAAPTINTTMPLCRNKHILSDTALKNEFDSRIVCESMANIPATGAAVPGALVGVDSDSTTAFRQLLTTCIIRFKDICNLFSELPLTRGLYMRVIMNMNIGNIIVGATGQLAHATNTVLDRPCYSGINQNTFPGTCPIMLSPLVVSVPTAAATQDETSINQWPSGAVLTVGPPVTAFAQIYDGYEGAFPTNSNLMIYPGVACDVGTVNRRALCVSVSIASADPIHAQLGYTGAALQSSSLQNCRIYAPIIDMEPSLVSAYITQHKEQAIYYRDVLYYTYPQVAAGDNFTYQIANGISNMKRLIIMPFYHDDTLAGGLSPGSAVAGDAAWGYPITQSIPFEPNSPFDSAPGTCAPQCSLQNFNILISNMNVFQRNINYTFENFIEEIAPANAINGGLDTGCTSGLVDYYKWTQNYRYYVVDLSRRLAGDNTPKSLTMVAQNASGFKVDYVFFVEYERHLSLDIESGHITVSSN